MKIVPHAVRTFAVKAITGWMCLLLLCLPSLSCDDAVSIVPSSHYDRFSGLWTYARSTWGFASHSDSSSANSFRSRAVFTRDSVFSLYFGESLVLHGTYVLDSNMQPSEAYPGSYWTFFTVFSKEDSSSTRVGCMIFPGDTLGLMPENPTDLPLFIYARQFTP